MVRRERQILRDGKLEEYNQQIKNLIDRGVVSLLNPEEAKKAPEESVWYFNHHSRTTR